MIRIHIDLTLANYLTLARFIAVLPVIMLILIDNMESRLLAAAIYLIACLTDGLDGWVARKFKQESYWGSCIDPIVDKIFVASTLISLLVTDSIDYLGAVAVIVIIAREFFVSGLRQALTDQGSFLSVCKLAKWKTAFQMAAPMPLMLDKIIPYAAGIGHILLGLAALLSIITAWIYLHYAWSKLIQLGKIQRAETPHNKD